MFKNLQKLTNLDKERGGPMKVLTYVQLQSIDRMIKEGKEPKKIFSYVIEKALGKSATSEQIDFFMKGYGCCMELVEYVKNEKEDEDD